VADCIQEEFRSKALIRTGKEGDGLLEIEYSGEPVCGEALDSLSALEGTTASTKVEGDRSILSLKFGVEKTDTDKPLSIDRKRGPVALLAEDEPVLRLAIRAMLESMGYEVVLAEDGAMAVEAFNDRYDEYTLALVDLNMPLIAGKRVVEAIRLKRPGLAVIKMSGDSEESVQEAFGSDDRRSRFLFKPFGVRELESAIASFKVLDKIGV